MACDRTYVFERLDRMRDARIWPSGPRYLWTDAFGLVLLVTLFEDTGDAAWLDAADELVGAVDRVLGRERGIRIGEAADRDGQYHHYLAVWLFAPARLSAHRPAHRDGAVALAEDVHRAFVVPGRGVHWKMSEDLSGPYPGHGLGVLDAYAGLAAYRTLDETALNVEIEQLRDRVEQSWQELNVDQDLALGMLLWTTHLFADERASSHVRERCLAELDRMWIEPPGCFCRSPTEGDTRFAFTNDGVSLGLQAVGA